uniref:Replication termination factor 2 n=1 Tax=Sus scrofa TaxID=9823 RepID=A0A8D1VID1_PIG
MGCDGGTIPKRHELVKGPKKVEKVDKDAELVAQWNYCTLSQEILRRPIVACELGRLYNKDAVIEFLLDKSSEKALGKAASHIKSIKNVTELRLSDNPAWEGDKGSTKGDKHDDLQRARFICPVVGLEMNGRHRFCYLRCCGCVFSERALKEIKAEVCHTCGAAFQEDDVIVLNGTKEDVAMLQTRMEERRLRAKLGKVPEPWVCPSPARAWVRVKSSGAAQPRPLLRGQPPTCRLGVCSDWGRFYDPEGPGLWSVSWARAHPGRAVVPLCCAQLPHP